MVRSPRAMARRRGAGDRANARPRRSRRRTRRGGGRGRRGWLHRRGRFSPARRSSRRPSDTVNAGDMKLVREIGRGACRHAARVRRAVGDRESREVETCERTRPGAFETQHAVARPSLPCRNRCVPVGDAGERGSGACPKAAFARGLDPGGQAAPVRRRRRSTNAGPRRGSPRRRWARRRRRAPG